MRTLGKPIFLCILASFTLAFGLSACSSDDGNDNGEQPQGEPQQESNEVEITSEIDLPYFDALNEDFSYALYQSTYYAGQNAMPSNQEAAALEEMRNAAEDNGVDLLQAVTGSNDPQDLEHLSVSNINVKYWSIDGDGNPIQLSGTIYLPKVKGKYIDCDDILLNCHATSLMDLMMKVGSQRNLVADRLVVLEPHYIGFGETRNMSQTYLCQKLIARQCTDMISAAMTVLEKKKVNLNAGYGTYVVGYSQGGGNSFAVGRYVEKEASDEVKKMVNLKKVTCGAGPYDPMGTFNYWLKADRLSLSMVLPMVIKGMMEGHRDIMKDITLQSYFSDLYLSTGIVDRVDKHQLGIDFLLVDGQPALADINLGKCENSKMFYWMQFSGIMSEEVKNPDSHIRKALEQCLTFEDVSDWMPTVPVEIFASKDDNVIPVEANAQAVYDKMVKGGVKNVKLNIGDYGDHVSAQMVFNKHLTNQGYRE